MACVQLMRKDAEQIGVWGCRGSGKTTRIRELCEGRKRMIALDPMETFKGNGWKRCRNVADMLRHVKAGWNTGFKLSLTPPMSESGCLALMRDIIPVLLAVQKPYFDGRRGMQGRDITLVVDEADLFFPNRKLTPEDGEVIEGLCRRGRHFGIETIAASQRLAQVSTTYRGNCSQHYFFAQGDHNDIQAAVAVLGPEHKATLRTLQAHEYLHKSRSAGAQVKRGKNTSKFVE